jgi:hypothetical protein
MFCEDLVAQDCMPLARIEDVRLVA